jgi:ankyrin repeat protein
MNQKKLHLTFSKHRNKGFLLDFLVKGLNINLEEEKYRRVYERLIKQEDLAAQEYQDTLQTIIDDIVYKLFPNHGIKRNLATNYIKELLKLYDTYVSTHPTMATSQKQLDFIMLITFVIPLVSVPLEENIFKVIVFIMPREKTTAIQNLFELININKIEKELDIKDTLFKYLDSNKDINYDAINKDVDNWLEGINVPDNRHIEMIIEALNNKTHYTKDELYLYFNLAKMIQYLYTKSVNYFGETLTKLLVFHYKYQVNFTKEFISRKMDKERFDKFLIQSFEGKDEKIIFSYFDLYFYTSFYLKYYSIMSSFDHDFYDESYKPKEILRDNFQYYFDFFILSEARFFETVDSHLPFQYFKGSMKLESIVYANESDINKEYVDFLNKFDKLNMLMDLNIPKDDNIRIKFTEIRKNIESMYELTNNPYIYFLDARNHAYNRAYKEATAAYLKALELGKNCVGEFIKSIITEGLIVSAKLIKEFKVNLKNSKSPFVKFYREGSFNSFISDLPEDISETFLNDMKKQFDIYFRNLYEEKQNNKSNMHITPNLFVTSNQNSIRIDYNKPNKMIYKNLPNPISQLMYCCSKCDFDAVKKLVDNGADVNLVKQSDRASAAMFATPGNIFLLEFSNKNGKKIVNYLIPKMSREVLNTQLIKRKETLLSCCIEYGWVESVELLIKHNVDLLQRATLDELSPLYQVIQCIHRSKTGELIPSHSKFTFNNPLESKDARKKLIKTNPFLQNITDEDRNIEFNKFSQYLAEDNRRQKIGNELQQITMQVYIDNKKNYIKIFKLILNALDKVDIPHKGNFTPLILATEINDEYIVKELLKKGANPDFYNDAHYRAYDYAIVNNNMALAELLE